MHDFKKVCELLEALTEELKALRRDMNKEKKPALYDLGFLNNDEFMALMGIRRGKAAQLRNSGAIPFSKRGGLIFYKITDIIKMLNGGFDSK